MLQSEALDARRPALVVPADGLGRAHPARRHPRRACSSRAAAIPVRGGLVRQQLGPRAAAAVAARADDRRARPSASSRSRSPRARGGARSSARSSPRSSACRTSSSPASPARCRSRSSRWRASARSRCPGITQSWGVPFPIAPLLAALIATVVGVVVGLPALRAARSHARASSRSPSRTPSRRVWFRNSQFVNPAGAVVTQPEAVRTRPRHRHRPARSRAWSSDCCACSRSSSSRWASPCCARSALGSAMLAVRANERSAAGIGVNVVRRKIAALRHRLVHRRHRRQPFAYRQGVVTFTSFTALGGLACSRPCTSPGITSVSGGILAGVLASSGIVFLALDRWVAPRRTGSRCITGVGLIATLIRYPEGLAAGGHELAPTARALLPDVAARTPRRSRRSSRRPSRRRRTDAGPGARGRTPHGPLRRRRRGRRRVAPSRRRARSSGSSDRTARARRASSTPSPVRTADGAVSLQGERIDGLPAHARVRRGSARTFQSLELYDDLTVEENVSAAVVQHGP